MGPLCRQWPSITQAYKPEAARGLAGLTSSPEPQAPGLGELSSTWARREDLDAANLEAAILTVSGHPSHSSSI